MTGDSTFHVSIPNQRLYLILRRADQVDLRQAPPAPAAARKRAQVKVNRLELLGASTVWEAPCQLAVLTSCDSSVRLFMYSFVIVYRWLRWYVPPRSPHFQLSSVKWVGSW
jgi:hypothetical protein